MLSRADQERARHLHPSLSPEQAAAFACAVVAVDARPLPRCDAVDALAEHLCELGLGALTYRRVQSEHGADHPLARRLRAAYLFHRLSAEVLQRATECVVTRLEGAGIPHVLFKGAAIARLYDDMACRPYGDVDVLVPDDRALDAACTLAARVPGEPPLQVDLEHTRHGLGLPTFQRLHARTRVLRIGRVEARTLDTTDTLSVACLHLAKHACARPIWLHDIALLMREGTPDFARIMRLPRHQTCWIASVLCATEALLGRCLPAEWRAWTVRHAEARASLASSYRARWGRIRRTRRVRIEALAGTPSVWWSVLGERWPDANELRYAHARTPAQSIVARQCADFTWGAVCALPRLLRASSRRPATGVAAARSQAL